MTTQLAPSPIFRAWDPNGLPLSYGKLYTYAAGTSTKIPSYVDSMGDMPNTNPVILTAFGTCALWLNPSLTYKFVLTDQFGNTMPGYPVDNIPGGLGALPFSASLIPNPTNTWTLGNSSFSWANLYLGPNAAPVLDSVSGNIGYYTQTTAERMASITPTNFGYAPGNILRYGADPTGVNDSTIAINAALLANPFVYDGFPGQAVYKISSTIYMQSAGQALVGKINGASSDESITPLGLPRTVFRWTGAVGGTLFSNSNNNTATGISFSNTLVDAICFDGNSLATTGIEVFNDSNTSSSGCWRSVFRNCAVVRCINAGIGDGIYLGGARLGPAHPFANDTIFENCYIYGCVNGLRGYGASYQVRSCTISTNTVGLLVEGNGSEWKFFGGVFHDNGTDFVTGAGTPIQNLYFSGTWFENSTSGVGVFNNSFNLQMIGCHLHTNYAICMLNMNGNAGHVTIASEAPASSASTAIINPNSGYVYDLLGTGIVDSAGYMLRAPLGALICADNADFLCGLTSNASSVTGDGTIYALNAAAVTEDHDFSNAVNAATGVFMAPVTGIYEFTVTLTLSGLTSSHTNAQAFLVTTVQSYQLANLNPFNVFGSGGMLTATLRAFMNKNDTAYPNIQVSGGTKVVSVLSGATATSWRTSFGGRLA
jgi:hypothetical protein